MKLSFVFATAISSFFVSSATGFSFSGQAQALTFSGISSATWGNPTPGINDTNPIYTGVGSNTFTWGQANLPPGLPNKLTSNGTSFSADINSVFKIADLTYFNGKVRTDSSVGFVPLNLNLSFSPPVGTSQVFDFNLRLVNTLNDPKDRENSADLVFLDTNLSNRSFTFGSNKYTLELIGFNLEGRQISIKALEEATTTTAIYAKIKTIPEPASVLGLSLLGIYLISRKNPWKINTGNRK
ncbi:MAG: choice-of-anchor K domain-containing protein [Nostoc sp. DedQUE08]|uniref:choice-of-anchor K domain-containing protein n=1 Tax=unclassified Nostoc TaxID=2593658 RepID=UPI002AD5900C|nr:MULTISPECIES: choice-of-anchor K domain-containing protein [unclassified Nostoc]MDZ8066834.1 choice-of-anchor K domain-containing protein [Nostoc sp. DedQUE08]MDZ8130118.1 choice-of-anchor K domain-containing protein [Nostoc sp. DedQUE07]